MNSKADILINNEVHNDLCIGIDLGTTNSVISIINVKPNGELVSKVIEVPRAINRLSSSTSKNRLEQQKSETLPSCVFYNDENNYSPIVGNYAKDQYSIRPHLVAKSIKSQMGEEKVDGLSENIPDKTPAQVSARILEHLLHYTEESYKCGKITDAIITVPANFDSAMSAATIKAAQLAGITVKNKDGSDRPILLSEPNAAIYDFLNQVRNGEIPNMLLDLKTPKKVMVFDLGGGTLDITMHTITRRDENLGTVKVDEIATNRYTLLGGDNFDMAIAEDMYRRFVAKYPEPSIQQKHLREKESLMPKFIYWGEELKKDINSDAVDVFNANWGDDEDEERTYPVGGNTGTNYSYEDDFTKADVERILEPFMGKSLKFEDYKQLEKIHDTNNIIYPILDVLAKGSAKLGTDDVHVDAVILNGGMSRFYMVKDRLTEFFGFEPLSVLNPDLAVARGAAVYHYYLHKNASLQDNMKVVSNKSEETTGRIEFGNTLLNDALYLGLKGGAVKDIVPTGAELPYESELMKGYKLQAGTNRISVPIKSRNNDGTYRTISTGTIEFKKSYKDGAYVAFKVHMDVNKVISMTAWTSTDEDSKKIVETGTVSIQIGDKTAGKKDSKIVAASGIPVDPTACISTILQLCKNKQSRDPKVRKAATTKIKEVEGEIYNCSNKEAFAPVILKALEKSLGGDRTETEKERLFVIARKIGSNWSTEHKTQLAALCLKQLQPEISGIGLGGMSNCVNGQAIYALGICGTSADMHQLKPLHDNRKYFQPCLYAHAKTRTQLKWVYNKFEEDYLKYNRFQAEDLQFTVYAIGNLLKKDGSGFVSGLDEESIVKKICELLRSDVSDNECFVPCVLALGLIGDTRKEKSKLSVATVKEMKQLLNSIEDYCYKSFGKRLSFRCRDIALKMIDGELLSEDEERFLLEKIESV